jgi:SAM-dependent methyltransferase
MTTTIDQPYAAGLTRANIERALAEAGKQTDALQASDLAMLEDFHSLGRLATGALIDLARITEGDRVLDAGTGIGGTARLIAVQRGAQVIAVDLTPEYCEVARWLNDAVGLDDMIEVLSAGPENIDSQRFRGPRSPFARGDRADSPARHSEQATSPSRSHSRSPRCPASLDKLQ